MLRIAFESREKIKDKIEPILNIKNSQYQKVKRTQSEKKTKKILKKIHLKLI